MDELKENSILEIPKPILIEDLGMMFHTKDSKRKYRFGLYKCGYCGNEFRASINSVKRGNTKSCGCYLKRRASETHKTHGLKNTRLYSIWSSMKMRAYNPKHKRYSDYGGRGITIREEWLDIHNFYNWAMSNGYSDGLSLDRIDNNGNYEPSNCRWTTKVIQARNQRKRRDNTSGYKGVYYYKRDGNYRAQICVNKEQVQLGRFSTPVEAGVAYNNYIIENKYT